MEIGDLSCVFFILEYFFFKLELWASMKIGFQNIRLQ